MDKCIFCEIGKGNIPAQKVYEDKAVFAILDISPRSPGHTMVIPKAHADTILELPDKDIAPFFKAIKKVTGMIQKALKPDGFTMGINHGSVSGQTVEHLHFHIIPRWFTDKGKSIHSVVNNPSRETLEKIANKIKAKK